MEGVLLAVTGNRKDRPAPRLYLLRRALRFYQEAVFLFSPSLPAKTFAPALCYFFPPSVIGNREIKTIVFPKRIGYSDRVYPNYISLFYLR